MTAKSLINNGEASPAQKGGLKSAGTMPKSHPLCNAARAQNRRFRQVFAPETELFAKILEMAEGAAGQQEFPAPRVEK